MKILFLILLSSINCFALDPLKEAEDNRMVGAPAIRSAAVSKKSTERAAAAIALGRIQKPEGLDILISLLKDKDNKVLEAAIFAIGQFAWQKEFTNGREQELVNAILPFLTHKNEMIRVRSVEAVAKLSPPDTSPTLIKNLLTDKSAKVKAAAIMGLFRTRLVSKLKGGAPNPDLPKEILDLLLPLAKSRETIVKQSLAYYFARTKDERALETIKALSEDPDHWVKLFATMALGKSGSLDTQEQLLIMLQDKNADVRVAAVQSLAAIKGKIPPSIATDKSWHVRNAFAESVADKSEYKDQLKNLWNTDASQTVRASALNALAQMDATLGKELITKAQADSSWVIRQAAAQAGANLDDTFLQRAAADSDPRVRASAVEQCAEKEGKLAFESIKAALSADDLALRGTAVESLSKRTEAEVLDLAWKTYQNSLDHKWNEVRETLVNIIGANKEDSATEYLEKILTDSSPVVASKAKQFLIERGKTEFPQIPAPKLTYSPYRELKFNHPPILSLYTNKGRMDILLYYKEAPIHVANIVGLARKGFYDGLIFHRVISNFVIQGGDPDGSGWGDAGYSVRAEINTKPTTRGTLAMPRSAGFDTGGVQIFISHIPTPHLDQQYTAFGKVILGQKVIDEIEVGDKITKARVRY